MLGLQILQLRDNVNKMSLSKSWAEFLLCFFISTDWTDVEKLNAQVVYTEYILLCNNFNRLPSRNSAITTAWVMR